jgi:hypothetical protein
LYGAIEISVRLMAIAYKITVKAVFFIVKAEYQTVNRMVSGRKKDSNKNIKISKFLNWQ